MGFVLMYKHFLHKSLINHFPPLLSCSTGARNQEKTSLPLSHNTDQKHSITLKISLTLLSIKTNIRSSFSLERALLCRIALEKDLFTASLFSIYRWHSTSLISDKNKQTKKTNKQKNKKQKMFSASNVNFEYVPNKFVFSTRCDIISNITSHVLYEYSVWVHMTWIWTARFGNSQKKKSSIVVMILAFIYFSIIHLFLYLEHISDKLSSCFLRCLSFHLPGWYKLQW